jgi:hypothetical protein
MVIFGNEIDYTTDFYASDSFVVHLSGLVLRRKYNKLQDTVGFNVWMTPLDSFFTLT